MIWFKLLRAQAPDVRPEFRHIAQIATTAAKKPRSRLWSWTYIIGLIGFILTFFLIITPPWSDTQEDVRLLKQRIKAIAQFSKQIHQNQRLYWDKEYVMVVSGYEEKSMDSFNQLLVNHLNSRKIVSIIRSENEAKISKRKRCNGIVPECRHRLQLKGRLPVKQWIKKYFQSDNAAGEYVFKVRHSGNWSPRRCNARHSVAIIIPYRCRKTQLSLQLQHLPPILKRQQINYSIFVVEQIGNGSFNKGILMNAGFLTALARPAHGVTFHCFIFHDVDLLAEDDRNFYTCPERPRHMSVAVDELDYELPYPELVGGVFAIRTEHFLEVNGYSNFYWGWGGEDDDMGLRVKYVFGHHALRPVEKLGRYSSVPHIKEEPSLPLLVRRRLKRMTKIRYKIDGLCSVKFKMVKIENKFAYTHLFVDVGLPPKNIAYYTYRLRNTHKVGVAGIN